MLWGGRRIAANLWTSEDPEFAGAKVWALAKEPLMSGSSVTPIGFINFNPPFMFIQPANPQVRLPRPLLTLPVLKIFLRATS